MFGGGSGTPSKLARLLSGINSPTLRARNDRMLATDPADGVTLPRARKAEHAMVIPSPGDVGKILAAAEIQFLPFVAMCAFAGLRLGEASAVQLTDIDFLRRTLKVQRQVQRAGKGEVAITPPKYGSERLVHIPDGLVQILAQHVELIGVHSVHQWLFIGDGGLPPHQNTSGYWWRKTVKAAGLSGVKLHDLRHFYASG